MMSLIRKNLILLQLMYLLQDLPPATSRLMLTPLIDQGKISKARELSQVKGDLWATNLCPLSYAGFITVDKNLGNHLFFWFFTSKLNSKAPLLIWLNGGPGVSSMLGLLKENGPVELSSLMSGNLQYTKRKYSWTDPFAMLYIDQPVGTGYSYSNNGSHGFRTNQEDYTHDLYSFIQQFYKLFPEYLQRELYIGGQSYAGHYVPALAYYIHTEKQAGKSDIPLTGIYLGAPMFAAQTQNDVYPLYLNMIGAISSKEAKIISKMWAKHYRQFVRNSFTSGYVMDSSSDLSYSELNNWVSTSDVDVLDNQVMQAMTSKELKAAVHVGRSWYTSYSGIISSLLYGDLFNSTDIKLASLMDNYKVLIYSGNYDILISPIMIEMALREVPWSLVAKYRDANRSSWIGNDKQLWGFYSQTGQFCHVVVHKAGHHVPMDQPQAAMNMMLQFINHGCIQSGHSNQ